MGIFFKFQFFWQNSTLKIHDKSSVDNKTVFFFFFFSPLGLTNTLETLHHFVSLHLSRWYPEPYITVSITNTLKHLSLSLTHTLFLSLGSWEGCKLFPMGLFCRVTFAWLNGVIYHVHSVPYCFGYFQLDLQCSPFYHLLQIWTHFHLKQIKIRRVRRVN